MSTWTVLKVALVHFEKAYFSNVRMISGRKSAAFHRKKWFKIQGNLKKFVKPNIHQAKWYQPLKL